MGYGPAAGPPHQSRSRGGWRRSPTCRLQCTDWRPLQAGTRAPSRGCAPPSLWAELSHQGQRGRKPVPVASPARVLTLPGEGGQAHTGVTQLDEGAGALRQPQPCQQDVPATHVPVNQVLVLLGWQTRREGMASWQGHKLYPQPPPRRPSWRQPGETGVAVITGMPRQYAVTVTRQHGG